MTDFKTTFGLVGGVSESKFDEQLSEFNEQVRLQPVKRAHLPPPGI